MCPAWCSPAAPATPTAPPQAPQVKVAFINLAYILKHSDKWNGLMDQMKNDSKTFEDFIKPRQQQIDALKAENNDTKTSTTKREENVATITRLNREIEDKTADARKLCGLYLALLNRMGVKADKFGDATAPLAGL